MDTQTASRTHHTSVYKSYGKSLSSLRAKDIDDFPSFEEAFNPVSLKKFFHDHDCLANCNIHYDCSTIEAQSSTPDATDIAPSPTNHDGPKFKDNYMFDNPTSEFYVADMPISKSDKNMEDTNSKMGYEIEPLHLSSKSSFVMPQNIEEKTTTDKLISDIQSTIVKCMTALTENLAKKACENTTLKAKSVMNEEKPQESKEETRLEKLVRLKKVFKIERNVQPQEVKSLNGKRSGDDALNEEVVKIQKLRKLEFKILKDNSNTVKEAETDKKEKKINDKAKDSKKAPKTKEKEFKETKETSKKAQNKSSNKGSSQGKKRRRKSFKTSSPISEGYFSSDS